MSFFCPSPLLLIFIRPTQVMLSRGRILYHRIHLLPYYLHITCAKGLLNAEISLENFFIILSVKCKFGSIITHATDHLRP